MSQERPSYQERNLQREERVLQHERALNESRKNAKHIKNPDDSATAEEIAKSFKRRRTVAITFGVLAILALIHALWKSKQPVKEQPPQEAVETVPAE